ncbi:MAG: outer membrane beta-barrel protein [Pseudorhodoplanes sp.]|nr:outer membrane beta-barrel protein [Pseudorhodoplanes sp.]
MARARRSAVVALLAAGAVLTCAAPACAQGARPATDGMTDSRLFVPAIDGDARNPNRFRRPAYGRPPAFGAGTSGFRSTNTRAVPRPPVPAVVEAAPLPPLAPTDVTVPEVYRAPPLKRPPSANPPELPSVHQRRAVVRRGPADEDPFGPLGIRAGAFVVKPAVELSGGYDTNPPRQTQKQGSPLWMVAPELLIKSDWSRHELQLDLRGSFTGYTDLPDYDRPMLDLKAKSRIDVSSQTRAELEARYNLQADSPGDPNSPKDAAKPPRYTTTGGTAALVQRLNRLEFTLKGNVDRRVYQDATLNDGTTLSLDDRNFTQVGGTLRGAYELSPGIKPFVEASLDRREHEPVSALRDSDGRTLRAGLQYELTRKLVGEISAGVLTRDYDNPAFANVRAPLVDTALTYFMTPLTTVKLEMKTTVDESILPGVSGSLTRDYSLQIDHSFRRWLIGTLRFGYGTDDYEGSLREDERYRVSAGLLYKMSREIWFKGEVRQDWLRSNVGGVDYTASAILFGVRLQR